MKRNNPILAAGILLAAALAPLPTQAAANTWTGAAGSVWDTSSASWTLPTTWVQGSDAIFGSLGAGSISLGTDITCPNMTFNASYGLTAGGFYFTNTSASGQSIITAAAGTSNNLALSIYGTNSVTFQGSGTNVLLGDAGVNDANHYTGSTYVKAGTLILRAAGNTTAAVVGSSHAVGNIEGIDAGAVVQIGTVNDGVNNIRPGNNNGDGQLLRGNNLGRLNLTGGTFDNNGDDNGINYPAPEGTGTIVNSSPWKRAVLKLQGGNLGKTYVFNGQIIDGGLNLTTSQGVAYQQNIDLNGNGPFTLVLGGSNSFTGFLRLNSGGNGNKVVLTAGGTLGYPAPINCPARQILMNSGTIDLNGTSQRVGYVYTGNNADSIITNSAFGTTSTLTVGYNCTNLVAFNGAATPRGIRSGLLDDPTTGGTLALVKEGVCLQPIGVYAADVGTAAGCNYHGDTTVNNGILEVLSTSGISSNSAYRLNSPGVLQLDYAGTANVKQLFVNGAQKANGTYGAADFPGIITGSGTLTVTGSTYTDKIWNNGATDFVWNTTSLDWTGSTWSQGDGAWFGTTGAGTITLGEDVICPAMYFGTNYSIVANTKYFTNTAPSGNFVITSATGTSNVLALSMYGASGIEFKGNGTTALIGDAAAPDGNRFTGGAYIRSGTVRLEHRSPGTANSSSSIYALDSVEALDAGATLVIPGLWNGVNGASSLRDQVAAKATSRMNLTGGTLDLYNDQKNQRIPVPEGTGTIINSGPNIQSGIQALIGTTDKTFAGIIADGNNGVLATNNNFNNGPGYQIGILQLNNGANGSGGVYILTGSNTYSGSTRIDCGNGGIRLAGNGQIGFPSPNGLTGPLRIIGNSFLDLGGRNQTIALMQDGSSTAQIYNSAVGTVSTLTIGYGNELANRSCSFQLKDNPGTGGIFALRKINTAPYVHWTGPTMNTCTQTLTATCVATYSGDTSVQGGYLILNGPSAVSPNSAYRLFPASGGTLKLNYAGTANARQLWINGVQQPNGVYGAGTPGIDVASTGTITVTGYAPATISAVKSGGNLNLTWSGVYKLQSSTNSVTGPYFDYPGAGLNAATVPVNPATAAVYFRLAAY